MSTAPDLFPDLVPAFPSELKKLNRWIVRTADKRPYSAWEEDENLGPIDPHNEQYQSDFDNAMGALAETTKFSGAGFVFNYKDGYTGIDFDDCVNAPTREIRAEVQEIIQKLDTYCEFSPSSTGIHAIVKGWQFPIGPEGQHGAKVGKAEMYSGKRYFTVSGNQVPGTSSTVNGRNVQWLYERIVVKREFVPIKSTNPKTVAADAGEGTPIVYAPGATLKTDKYSIFLHGVVDRQQGFHVSNGVGSLSYPSQSEADLGFATVLALVHDGHTEKMDADFRKSALYRDKWEREDYRDRTFRMALETANKIKASKPYELTAVEILAPAEVVGGTVAVSDDDIPPFDETAITGIYRKIVDLVTDGTTIPKQFAFLAAKVFIGARMAGKVTFENMDADSSYYGVVIAETGTGKGLAWRRTVENSLMMGESLRASVKIIQSADSGAGLKDAFFEDSGQPLTAPVICYVDEATSLGHKAGEKKNPEIVDTIIELADGHRISRVLARNGKKTSRTNDNARLSLYMCGQNGEVFMQAFAGRTKLGLYDRFYPEYSPNVEAGDLPDIDTGKAVQVWTEINELLKTSGQMKMSDGVKMLVDEFWKSQPSEYRKRVRWKKHLMLDMYMAAFGRGSMFATAEDWEGAKKLYLRQVAIREEHFTTEVPDKIGVYNSRLRAITERMRARLKAGETVQQVALSQRDFINSTNAYRDNDVHTFNMAWRHWEGALLASVPVIGGNGQKYTKYVPMPNEDETWKMEG